MKFGRSVFLRPPPCILDPQMARIEGARETRKQSLGIPNARLPYFNAASKTLNSMESGVAPVFCALIGEVGGRSLP
jgi:hypothetical protein